MDQTGDHASSDHHDEEDDLLKTIRQMVSDEAARAPAQAPPHFPGAEPAALAQKPAEPQPLVLGAMARVQPEGDGPVGAAPDRDIPAGSALAALASETGNADALRTLVQEAVREELDLALGDTLAHRVRQLVRRELADLLSQAREEG